MNGSRPNRLPLLAAAVAHEFNEELMVIVNSADLLLQQLGAHPARKLAVELEHSAQRCAELTRGLQAYSRRSGTRPQRAALARLIADS